MLQLFGSFTPWVPPLLLQIIGDTFPVHFSPEVMLPLPPFTLYPGEEILLLCEFTGAPKVLPMPIPPADISLVLERGDSLPPDEVLAMLRRCWYRDRGL